jgi:hypothetical protein
MIGRIRYIPRLMRLLSSNSWQPLLSLKTIVGSCYQGNGRTLLVLRNYPAS